MGKFLKLALKNANFCLGNRWIGRSWSFPPHLQRKSKLAKRGSCDFLIGRMPLGLKFLWFPVKPSDKSGRQWLSQRLSGKGYFSLGGTFPLIFLEVTPSRSRLRHPHLPRLVPRLRRWFAGLHGEGVDLKKEAGGGGGNREPGRHKIGAGPAAAGGKPIRREYLNSYQALNWDRVIFRQRHKGCEMHQI